LFVDIVILPLIIYCECASALIKYCYIAIVILLSLYCYCSIAFAILLSLYCYCHC